VDSVELPVQIPLKYLVYSGPILVSCLLRKGVNFDFVVFSGDEGFVQIF